MSNQYTFVNQVGKDGKGGCAKVCVIKDNKNKLYILKKPFHPVKFLNKSTGIINMKEIFVLSCVKHPYIQSANVIFFDDPCPNDGILLESTQGLDRVSFLMTKAEMSSHDLVHGFHIPISYVKRLLFQVTCAVNHLHALGICHRDIKPGNILCYKYKDLYNAKLTDFGMTKPINRVNKNSLHAGTPWYRSPEMLLENKEYGFSSDIWSLATTFIELTVRRAPFKGENPDEILSAIWKTLGTPDKKLFGRLCGDEEKVLMVQSIGRPRGVSSFFPLTGVEILNFNAEVFADVYNPGKLDQFIKLVTAMLQLDPDKRPKIDKVLKDPFFSGFFQRHDAQRKLYKPNSKTLDINYMKNKYLNTLTQYYPRNHPNECVVEGASEIANMKFEECTVEDDEIGYTIRFHGLDLFYRFLIKIEPFSDMTIYRKLAWCSAYIASKYFLDEISEHLYDLFPDSLNYITTTEIIVIERHILQVVDFEIYKPTLFTFLEHKAFYAALFALTVKGSLVFDKPIKDIMKIWNEEVEIMTKMYGATVVPL